MVPHRTLGVNVPQEESLVSLHKERRYAPIGIEKIKMVV